MTHDSHPQPDTTRIDTKLLSNLIYQMNIVRRQVGAYPPGHQVIRTAVERTLKVLKSLGDTADQITIGIARDRLMLGSVPLEPKNPVYREYARALFAHGLVALTIRQGLNEGELCEFCRLLACRPEEILALGGLVAASTAAGIGHLTLTPLNFRHFHTRDAFRPPAPETAASTDPLPAWEHFVSALLTATGQQPPPSELAPPAFSPQRLAGEIGQRLGKAADRANEGYDKAIASFLRDLDRENRSLDVSDRLLCRFRDFVSELQPQLRRQFLSSTFSALAVHEEHAGKVLSRFSNDLLLDALDDLNRRRTDIPPFVLHLLGQLAPHGTGRQEAPAEFPAAGPSSGCASGDGDPFKLVFSEHRVDAYVPEDYQDLLRRCPSSQPVQTLPPEVVDELTASVDEQSMEQRLCAVVTHMLQTSETSAAQAGLQKHLSTFIEHFIDTGDFSSLTELHRAFSRADTPRCRPLPQNPLGIFDSYHFTREIVRCLSVWPREKQAEIENLIQRIGPSFVPLLLDRLAEESDRSLRHRYLQLLQGMGPGIREEVLKRLQDKRWYVLRNLIVLVRGLRDPGLLNAIEPLQNHPHERVRQEALITGYAFGDPGADKSLLKELHKAPLPPPWAIGMAQQSRNTKVFQHLLTLLQSPPLSNEGLAVRMTAVTTLAKMGNPAALRELESVLFGFNLRHPRRHRRLQRHIVASLSSYPPEATSRLLQRIRNSIRPDLAELRPLLNLCDSKAAS